MLYWAHMNPLNIANRTPPYQSGLLQSSSTTHTGYEPETEKAKRSIIRCDGGYRNNGIYRSRRGFIRGSSTTGGVESKRGPSLVGMELNMSIHA